MKKRIEAEISGRVQMVNFRFETVRKAKSLNLVGFVQNNDGGTVNVVAEGDEDKLRIFLDFLQKGPQGAQVDDVSTSWSEPVSELKDFTIVY